MRRYRSISIVMSMLVMSMLLLATTTACRDEAVGIGDPDVDASPPADVGVSERCADWQPTPGEPQVWNSTEAVGERNAAGAVGFDGTMLAAWVTPDGIWARARCASGAPLRQGGLDTKLDEGGAVSLHGPDIAALPDGGFVVTWRDDTDDSVRAVWLDAEGQPADSVVQVSTADATAARTDRPPRVLLMTDSVLSFVWGNWIRRYELQGTPRTSEAHLLDNEITLDVSPKANGELIQLANDNRHDSSDSVHLEMRFWSFDQQDLLTLGIGFGGNSGYILHRGRRNFVLARLSVPSPGAAVWIGNWPYEIWMDRWPESGMWSSDIEMLGDGGNDAPDDGWVDVAFDGRGVPMVTWRRAEGAGEIHTWTQAADDQILLPDSGDPPRFPRVAGYPDGGFLLLLSPVETAPDEDVLFLLLDR